MEVKNSYRGIKKHANWIFFRVNTYKFTKICIQFFWRRQVLIEVGFVLFLYPVSQNRYRISVKNLAKIPLLVFQFLDELNRFDVWKKHQSNFNIWVNVCSKKIWQFWILIRFDFSSKRKINFWIFITSRLYSSEVLCALVCQNLLNNWVLHTRIRV